MKLVGWRVSGRLQLRPTGGRAWQARLAHAQTVKARGALPTDSSDSVCRPSNPECNLLRVPCCARAAAPSVAVPRHPASAEPCRRAPVMAPQRPLHTHRWHAGAAGHARRRRVGPSSCRRPNAARWLRRGSRWQSCADRARSWTQRPRVELAVHLSITQRASHLRQRTRICGGCSVRSSGSVCDSIAQRP